ncbi:MAG: discoidin domain-containing protein, partial [Pirellulales bacterium]|nr:discoidin domain-containing protein [Pirellulales bacterium]
DFPNDAISFGEGRLRDRRKAIHAEKKAARSYEVYRLPETHWIASWSDPQPVTITFDLQQPHSLTEVKIWYRDCLAALICEGSPDGQTWYSLAEATAQHGAPGDVYDQIIALHAAPRSRYLRLRFAGRNAGEILTLSEVEIWSAEPDRQPD